MPLSVRLDRETEAKINQLARKKRVSKSLVVREAIAVYAADQEAGAESVTPAQAMAPFIGIVAGGDAHRSERTGERFRALLLKKRRARSAR